MFDAITSADECDQYAINGNRYSDGRDEKFRKRHTAVWSGTRDGHAAHRDEAAGMQSMHAIFGSVNRADHRALQNVDTRERDSPSQRGPMRKAASSRTQAPLK